MKYRTVEEVEYWRQRDPIQRLATYTLDCGLLTVQDLERTRQDARDEADRASRLAEESPNPSLESLSAHLYG
jgi:pyruvate dehydrogenase E1 component alpha subunit